MATSPSRTPRKSATDTPSAEAGSTRKPAAGKKAGVAKKAAATRKTAAPKKSPATKKAAAASKASSATKAAAKKVAAVKKAAAAKKARARTSDAAQRLHEVVLKALDDLKARDVVEIDVRTKSSVTDLLVIASGTSGRHVRSIAGELIKKTKEAGMPPLGVEGEREGEWVLVDLGDIVAHVMLPRVRDFYGLERLWTVGDLEGDDGDGLAG